MLVYKVKRSKVFIEIALFLAFILIRLSIILSLLFIGQKVQSQENFHCVTPFVNTKV